MTKKERILSSNKRAYRHRAKPAGRMTFLGCLAKYRAKQRGIYFDNRLFKLLRKHPATHCLCCHVKLDYSLGRGRNNRLQSPSLDRVDNTKGYTVSNTRVICSQCNTKKKDLTPSDIEMFYQYVVEQ